MSLLQRTASALAGDRTGKSDLNLDQIRTDGGTQPRAEINMSVVRDYADALTNGVELPAVTVFYDGTSYWLADGYHRLAAHKLADKRSILADVRQGTQREAVLWSVGANAEHGLRRTDEDKRRAVLRLLEDQEWGGWSDREIARQCKVSPTMVGKLRSGLTVHVDSERPQERTYTTKHGTQATMRTGNIGAKVSDDRIRQWLLDYADRQGRTWRELSDNQIYHANSPCYQSFVAAFPTLSNPKQLLVNALVWIRSDAETTQRIKDAERLYVRDGQFPTPKPLAVAFDNAAHQTDEREAAADAAVAEYQAAQAVRAAEAKKHLDGWLTNEYRIPADKLNSRIQTLRGLGKGKTAGAEFLTRGALTYLDRVGVRMDREELQRHADALADELEPRAKTQDARLGRLRATVAAVLESLEDDDLRNAAAAAKVGPAYGQAIEMLRTVHGATQ